MVTQCSETETCKQPSKRDIGGEFIDCRGGKKMRDGYQSATSRIPCPRWKMWSPASRAFVDKGGDSFVFSRHQRKQVKYDQASAECLDEIPTVAILPLDEQFLPVQSLINTRARVILKMHAVKIPPQIDSFSGVKHQGSYLSCLLSVFIRKRCQLYTAVSFMRRRVIASKGPVPLWCLWERFRGMSSETGRLVRGLLALEPFYLLIWPFCSRFDAQIGLPKLSIRCIAVLQTSCQFLQLPWALNKGEAVVIHR